MQATGLRPSKRFFCVFMDSVAVGFSSLELPMPTSERASEFQRNKLTLEKAAIQIELSVAPSLRPSVRASA